MAARRLKTVQDLRRYLAGLLNRAESGEVTPALAGKLCYIANSLLPVIESCEVEQRIARLEEHISKSKQR